MYKHKIISKSHSQKDVRSKKEQSDKRDPLDFASDSDSQSQNQLQEFDLNPSYYSEEQSQSIQDFLQNLNRQDVQHFCEESSSSQEDVNEGYSFVNQISLKDINATYMKKMGETISHEYQNSSLIKFDQTVRIKFFNDQQPVAQVYTAQQYTTPFNQYIQTIQEEQQF